jgi:DNA-binding SARP family transcriptional activator/tetratricopeptide (TPR) repeat protein
MGVMDTLAVRVLGDLDVDGVDLASLGSRKGRTLLWLLALGRGSAVPVDVLVDAIWPEGAPAKPADQLAVLVSRLRAVLGRERIVRGDSGYRLVYDWLDVDELDAVTAETAARLADGNHPGASVAGRVVASLLRDARRQPESTSDWVTTQVAALDRDVARSRRTAAAALLAGGAWLDAADLAADALAADAFDEQALRVLMRANVAGGRSAVALAAYAVARRMIVEELGTDPSPDTEALHEAILRGELSSADATGSTVPSAHRRRLVGRRDELAALDAAADGAGSGVRVVVVQGEAGIGKTSLVADWTSRRAATHAVLVGRCGDLGLTAPLDPLVVPLAEHLHRLDDERLQEMLGADASLLAPMLGLSAAATMSPLLADGIVGPSLLYGALAGVLERLAERRPVILVLDDAHLGGQALGAWVSYVRRRSLRLVVVASVRTPQSAPFAADDVITLHALGPDETLELVGAERADVLYARSGGHPLFLTELALADASETLPASLVDTVWARCDALGRVGETLTNAAVVGARVDPDLLAAVLHRPAVELLDDAEEGVRHQLLVDDGGTFRFRHELVREALASRVTAGRTAWLHRQVARTLARRRGSDPAEVAEHARLGGDLELAATSLRAASVRAAERFDHASAERALDEALELHPDPQTWLDRARVRTRQGHYEDAYADVARARSLGADALEVGAWASYFDRRFEQAITFATDGVAIAERDDVRARCLTVAGRTRHAAGELGSAEQLLLEAIDTATGLDRLVASAWLGVLRSHQSRPGAALALLRPVTRPELRAEHSSAVLHALLFTGHAHALAGRPAPALAALASYTSEVERRQMARFEGRGVNFGGWVLRNVGAREQGTEDHLRVLELSRLSSSAPELGIAALEDLAEDRLAMDDVDAAHRYLDEAAARLGGDLVFGWRLDFKHRLLRARAALAQGDAETALGLASDLAKEAGGAGVPRYSCLARLLVHHARRGLGEHVDLDAVQADLDATRQSIALEAWWWIGDSAAVHGVPGWVDDAADAVDSLARESGEHAADLRRASASRLDAWRAAAG